MRGEDDLPWYDSSGRVMYRFEQCVADGLYGPWQLIGWGARREGMWREWSKETSRVCQLSWWKGVYGSRKFGAQRL
jgi:hypothetical protein